MQGIDAERTAGLGLQDAAVDDGRRLIGLARDGLRLLRGHHGNSFAEDRAKGCIGGTGQGGRRQPMGTGAAGAGRGGVRQKAIILYGLHCRRQKTGAA